MTAGEPPRIVDGVRLPAPGEDEVLVRVDHAGVNPIDTYAAAGTVGDTTRLPRTLGVEGTGIIEGTGTGTGTGTGGGGGGLSAGSRVVVTGSGLGLVRDGTWAGALVAPRDAVVEVPAELDPAQAGAIGTAAVTAYEALHVFGRVTPDDRVLVLGAGGGVGVVAVQLAKIAGATVVGQVGSAVKADAVEGLGADRVVVTGADDLVTEVGGFRPTLVVDPLGGQFTPGAVELAAIGGRIVILGVSAGQDIPLPGRTFYRKALSLLGYGGLVSTPARRATAVQAVAADIVAGRLHIPIDEVVPLAHFDDAATRLRDRSVLGKVILATQR